VTDADIALGYLDPDYFLAGAVKLDVDAAREALERAGKPLGFGADETAAAANRIVDNQMADAIRLASVQQGYDPRGFVMYAYGGAGAVHLPAIARELGIRRLVIPLSDLAAGWSAFGVSSSDVVLVAEHPVNLANPFDPAVLNEAWAHLEAGLRKKLEAQGISSDRMTWQREVDMRYSLQVHEVRVPAPAGRCSADTADHLIAAFEREYENLFGAGTGYPDAGFALTAARLTARGTVGSGSLAPEVSTGGPASSPKSAGERGVIWYERGPEREATPVFDGEALKPGMELEGPAIVDFPHTTLVLRHDQRAHVDAFGSTIVDM
jgi:N-methylhydantoinase A